MLLIIKSIKTYKKRSIIIIKKHNINSNNKKSYNNDSNNKTYNICIINKNKQ